MTAIQGAQNHQVGGIGGGGLAPEGSYLSPEMVLFTLKTRLNNIDGQIERINDMINYKTEQAKALNERIANLQGILQDYKESDEIDTTELTAEQRALLEEEGLTVSSEEELQHINGLIRRIDHFHRVEADDHGIPMDPAEREAYLAEIDGDLRALGIDPDDLHGARAELQRMRDTELEPNQIEQAINRLNTELSKLNAGNETQMLTLQQIVSQRGQEVTLATNMLRKMNDAASKIANNI